MDEYILLGLVAIIVLGILAQWLSWRLRISSVILFIFFGIIAGPLAGIIQPDQLFGHLLLPFVSLSVAVILFEGGLGLNLKELRAIGKTLNLLISVGVLITWIITIATAYYILDLEIRIALLLGALLVVTGPTVIIPLLRQVRPKGKAGALLKWEGILIDPIGALLAVLVFQATFAIKANVGFLQISLNFFQALLTGASLGVIGGVIIVFLLENRKLPEYLHSPVTLMILLIVFALSNLLQTESGLLAATVMGIVLANQKRANVKKIVEFKETLGLMLLSCLFIVLTARLSLDDLLNIGWPELAFLAIMIFVTRPLAVFISALGSNLNRQEKLFLSFMAPRGVVAVSVTSLFALRLSNEYMVQADQMVPITFIVVIGTVLFYSIIAMPLARGLGLAQPDPQGILFLGANKWARMIAIALKKEGFEVTMVDTNPTDVKRSREKGITAIQENILSPDIEERIDFSGLGKFMALSSNDEINSLAVLNFSDLIDKDNLFQLPLRTNYELPIYLRGRMLFDKKANYDYIERKVDEGAVIREIELSEETDLEEFKNKYNEELIPLFVLDENKELTIITEDKRPLLKKGSRLFALSGENMKDTKATLNEES